MMGVNTLIIFNFYYTAITSEQKFAWFEQIPQAAMQVLWSISGSFQSDCNHFRSLNIS